MRKLFLLILCFSTFASANQSDSFVKEWSKLVKMSGSAIDELQPGCVPRIIKANLAKKESDLKKDPVLLKTPGWVARGR